MTDIIDIQPATRQIRPILGATTIEITYTVQDANGTPVNLTGATHRCLVKRRRSDPDTDAICALSVTVAAPATGRVILRLVPSSTGPDPYQPPIAGLYYPDYDGRETRYGYVSPGTYYASHLFVLDRSPHTPLELMLIFRLPVTRSVV